MKNLFFFLILALACHAEEPTLPETLRVGSMEYHKVQYQRRDPARVYFIFEDGSASVLIGELAPELQKNFNYNAADAAQFSQEQAAKIAEQSKKVAEISLRNDQKSREQNKEAGAESSKKTYVFKVIGSHPSGLRVAICEKYYKQATSASGLPMPTMAHGYSGKVNMAAGAPVETIRETSSEALLVGYSKKHASGEFIKVSAVETGTKDLGPQYGGEIVKVFQALK